MPLSGPGSGSGFWHSNWSHFPDQILVPDSGTQMGATFWNGFCGGGPKTGITQLHTKLVTFPDQLPVSVCSHQSPNTRSHNGRRLPGSLVQEGCHTSARRRTHSDPESGVQGSSLCRLTPLPFDVLASGMIGHLMLSNAATFNTSEKRNSSLF